MHFCRGISTCIVAGEISTCNVAMGISTCIVAGAPTFFLWAPTVFASAIGNGRRQFFYAIASATRSI